MPTRRDTGGRVPAVVLAGLAVIVAIGFVLRLRGIHQTLYGDEYFTHSIVTRYGLRGVWNAVYHTSITPPLHYYLAWASLKLGGDTTVMVRLPSLVLGTLTIPLVFLLGRRVAGWPAGLLAATLFALAPFAIWYGEEGRAYATMVFCLTLALVALLRAVGGEGRGWWALYAVSACAALWSHYSAVFVVLASLVWALWAHRERSRAVLFSALGIAVGYAPWLPGFLAQRKNKGGIEIIDQFAPLHPWTPVTVPLQTLAGHPFFPLARVPGTGLGIALAVLALGLVVVAAARRPPAGNLRSALRGDGGLVLVAALATVAGLLVYALSGTSLFLPRNLSASVPAMLVAIAAALTWAARRLPAGPAWVVVGVLVAVFAVDTAHSEEDAFRRPPYREATRYVDRVAPRGDPLVESPLAVQRDSRVPTTTLDLYLRHPGRRVYLSGSNDDRAWSQLDQGRDVWLISTADFAPGAQVTRQPHGDEASPGMIARAHRLGGPGGLARQRQVITFPGLTTVQAIRYRGTVTGTLRRRGGRETIDWSFGRSVRVVPGAARGRLELASRPPKRLLLYGWALRGHAARPADWILVFAHGRLVATSAGGIQRADIARRFGESARLSGWAASPGVPLADRSSLRVFAVAGDQATELPRSAAARAVLR